MAEDWECRECRDAGGEWYPEHTDDNVCSRCGAEMEQTPDE